MSSKALAEWSKQDVKNWINSLSIHENMKNKVIQTFESNEVTGAELVDVNNKTELKDLGLPVLLCNKILSELQSVQNKEGSSSNPPQQQQSQQSQQQALLQQNKQKNANLNNNNNTNSNSTGFIGGFVGMFSRLGTSNSNNNGNNHGFRGTQQQAQMSMEIDDESQQQAQMLIKKQDQVQETVDAQMVLNMTQKTIKNIKTLAHLYSQNNNNNNSNSNENESQIFIQKMITGQLLNALRMIISDKSVIKNDKAHNLSLIEIGKFKQEALNCQMPKNILDKIVPYIDSVIQTLQDYKKSCHIPGPKLDNKTFNQESVGNGMSLYLQGQHNVEKNEKIIRENEEKYRKDQNNAINTNKNILNTMKNEKINNSSIQYNNIFGDVDKNYLDIGNDDSKDDEDDILDEVAYGITSKDKKLQSHYHH